MRWIFGRRIPHPDSTTTTPTCAPGLAMISEISGPTLRRETTVPLNGPFLLVNS
ncbi:hypothetical protein ABIE32_001082 [Comamonas sp. 4034]